MLQTAADHAAVACDVVYGLAAGAYAVSASAYNTYLSHMSELGFGIAYCCAVASWAIRFKLMIMVVVSIEEAMREATCGTGACIAHMDFGDVSAVLLRLGGVYLLESLIVDGILKYYLRMARERFDQFDYVPMVRYLYVLLALHTMDVLVLSTLIRDHAAYIGWMPIVTMAACSTLVPTVYTYFAVFAALVVTEPRELPRLLANVERTTTVYALWFLDVPLIVARTWYLLAGPTSWWMGALQGLFLIKNLAHMYCALLDQEAWAYWRTKPWRVAVFASVGSVTAMASLFILYKTTAIIEHATVDQHRLYDDRLNEADMCAPRPGWASPVTTSFVTTDPTRWQQLHDASVLVTIGVGAAFSALAVVTLC